jgi:hypothetical protein
MGAAGVQRRKIIYSFNMIFHTSVPYLDLLITNRLVEKSRNKVRHKTTAKGEAALRCFRELEEMIPETGVKEGPVRYIIWRANSNRKSTKLSKKETKAAFPGKSAENEFMKLSFITDRLMATLAQKFICFRRNAYEPSVD